MSKKWYNYFVSVEGQEGEAVPDGDPKAPPQSDPAAAIAAIAASVQVSPQVQSKFEQSAASPAPTTFADIYRTAEIPQPGHGYSVLKVADMLSSEHIRSLPAEVKRSSILVALDAAGVKIQEVIEDAVRRDKALDAFERVQAKQLETFALSKEDENRKLQAEIDKLVAEHKARIEANNDQVAKQKESFAGWRLQKQLEEQKIADAVSYFVTENPITTTARPSAPPTKP
jgi:hypothetical protein